MTRASSRPYKHAAITALVIDQEWIDARNAHLQDRRDRVVSALRNVGVAAEFPKASPLRLEPDSRRYVLG